MTLFEVVDRLDELDETNGLLTIYAVEPWRPESEAIVVDQPEDGATRIMFKTTSGAEASYFLEVFIAKDFLCGWRADRRSFPEIRSSSLQGDCERLVGWAINDA